MENDAALQTNAPKEKVQEYPKYRWVILIIFLYVTMIDLFFVVAVSPIMTSLQETFNTDLTTIGFASTIVTTLSGVFMFLAAVITGRLNVRKSYIVSTVLLLVGNIVVYFSTSVGMFIVGRGIVGAGFGLSGALVAAVVFMWFPPKTRPMIFTANALSVALVQMLGFNIIVPIYTSTGKWQTIFLLCIVLSAIGLLLWTFLGRDFDINTGGAPKVLKNGPKVHPFESLFQAFKSKQLWVIALIMTSASLCFYTMLYFYPAYLINALGLPQANASSLTSILFLAGIGGSFLGGFLCTALGRRKIIIIAANIVGICALIGLFSFRSTGPLIGVMVLYGLFNNMRGPAAQTASLEVEGMTPAMGAGASSMLFGFSSLMTLILSPLVTSFINMFGFSKGMMVLTIGLISICLIFSLIMKDNGPKAKAKK